MIEASHGKSPEHLKASSFCSLFLTSSLSCPSCPSWRLCAHRVDPNICGPRPGGTARPPPESEVTVLTTASRVQPNTCCSSLKYAHTNLRAPFYPGAMRWYCSRRCFSMRTALRISFSFSWEGAKRWLFHRTIGWRETAFWMLCEGCHGVPAL